MGVAWTNFIENPSAERVYLMRLGVAHDNGASIDTRTLYVATHPKEFTHYYYPCVAGVPRLNRSLQDVFTGWSMPSWGNLILLREDNYSLTPDSVVDFDDLVSGEWECAGRNIEILFGGDNLAESDYQTIMKGVVDKVENWDNEKIEISILDMQEQLRKKEVAKNEINTTDYPNAAESIIGKRKPFAIGDCKNIKPVLVDKTARKYLVHDTDIADLTDIVTVYAKGVSVAFAKQLAAGTFTLNSAQTGTITCDAQGFKYDDSYVEHVGDIFKGLLITCGGIGSGDILTADITAINTAFPYDLWGYVTGEDSVLDVLDRLAQGLSLWYGFTREAKFEIKEFTVPSGSPDLSLDTRSIQPKLKGKSSGDVAHKITVKYDENPSKMSANSIGSVTDDYKAWLEEQWREEISEDSDVLDLYPLAEEREFKTVLRDRADATAVGGKWLILLKVKRFETIFLVKSPALSCHLGNVLKITFPRFGLASGVLHRVVKIEESYSQNEYVITAWR